MQILQDLLSIDEIERLKTHWATNTGNSYINWQMEDGRIIDHRLQIVRRYDVTEFDPLINRIIERVFDPDQIIGKWAAYQRQTNPHHQHIDDFGKDECEQDLSLRMYTFIVALDTIPEFKTIVWKEGATSNEKFMPLWRSLITRKSRISEQEDLEHIPRFDFNGEQCCLADFLTLDGIFSYQAGWGCLFNGKQIHTTSYWLKYPQHTHRDLLQIHVLTHQHLDDWDYYQIPDQKG